jgi:hypothetical protein
MEIERYENRKGPKTIGPFVLRVGIEESTSYGESRNFHALFSMIWEMPPESPLYLSDTQKYSAIW